MISADGDVLRDPRPEQDRGQEPLEHFFRLLAFQIYAKLGGVAAAHRPDELLS
jgi:hypothetical protein